MPRKREESKSHKERQREKARNKAKERQKGWREGGEESDEENSYTADDPAFIVGRIGFVGRSKVLWHTALDRHTRCVWEKR
jgi:hypothetical protein